MNFFNKKSDITNKEEVSEEKLKVEYENKLITNQNNIISNMKCPICEHTVFTKADINIGDSGASIEPKINTHHIVHNKEYENRIFICDRCGYVLVFADFATEKRKNINV